MERRTFLGTVLGGAAISALPKAASAHIITPSYKLYDTHAHFYTSDVDKYPIKAVRFPEVTTAKVMRYPQTPKEIFAFWDECGIAKGCGVQYNTTYQTDNRYLLDIAKIYPDRIVPVVILNPLDAKTPSELERMARENRISGVRLTGPPDAQGNYSFLTDAAAPTWEAANRLGLVIVLMPVGGNIPATMKRIGDLAAKYPNVNIVLDHIGFPRPADFPPYGFSPEHVALTKYKNVYYKYTSFLLEMMHQAKVPFRPFLEQAVKTFNANQMVWGSDVGNSNGSMAIWVQQALASAEGLSQAQQKALFFDTAERVFVPGGRGPARA